MTDSEKIDASRPNKLVSLDGAITSVNFYSDHRESVEAAKKQLNEFFPKGWNKNFGESTDLLNWIVSYPEIKKFSVLELDGKGFAITYTKGEDYFQHNFSPEGTLAQTIRWNTLANSLRSSTVMLLQNGSVPTYTSLSLFPIETIAHPGIKASMRSALAQTNTMAKKEEKEESVMTTLEERAIITNYFETANKIPQKVEEFVLNRVLNEESSHKDTKVRIHSIENGHAKLSKEIAKNYGWYQSVDYYTEPQSKKTIFAKRNSEGKLHSYSGPALITYNQNGDLYSYEYYLDGVLTSIESWKEATKLMLENSIEYSVEDRMEDLQKIENITLSKLAKEKLKFKYLSAALDIDSDPEHEEEIFQANFAKHEKMLFQKYGIMSKKSKQQIQDEIAFGMSMPKGGVFGKVRSKKYATYDPSTFELKNYAEQLETVNIPPELTAAQVAAGLRVLSERARTVIDKRTQAEENDPIRAHDKATDGVVQAAIAFGDAFKRQAVTDDVTIEPRTKTMDNIRDLFHLGQNGDIELNHQLVMKNKIFHEAVIKIGKTDLLSEEEKVKFLRELIDLEVKATDEEFFKAAIAMTNQSFETIKAKTPTLKEEKKKKMGIDFKSEARESLYRGMIRRMRTMLAAAVANLLTTDLPEEKKGSARDTISEILKTPHGEALFSVMIGAAIPVVASQLPEEYGKYVDEAAREFRVSGGGDLVYAVSGTVAELGQGLISEIKSNLEQLKQFDEKNTTNTRVEIAKTDETKHSEEMTVEQQKAALASKK